VIPEAVHSTSERRLPRWGINLAIIFSSAYILIFVVVAVLRMGYHYELEWLEGSMVDHVARVLHSLPLYVPPSLDFIPTMYTPLYYYVSALIASVTGLGFLPLRLVSFLSAVGCFAVIFQLVRRETGQRWPAIIATGLFAATYVVTGTFFDLARVDAFAAFFLFLGTALIHRADRPSRLMPAAVVFSLAFFAKQSALVPVGFLTMYVIYSVPRRSVWFIAPLVALIGCGALWMNHSSGGWFLYYVFEMPGRHAFMQSPLKDFFDRNLFKHAPILCLIALLYLGNEFRARRRKSLVFALCLLAGFTIISFLGKVKIGGYTNNLIPVYGALAIVTGFLLGSPERLVFFRRHTQAFGIILSLALVLQFARLWHDPVRLVPTEAMVNAGNELVRRLSEYPGRIYMPNHGYIPEMVGKPPTAHYQAYIDLVSADSAAGRAVMDELAMRLNRQAFSLVVLDTTWGAPMPSASYRLITDSTADSVTYRPWMEGERFCPRYWYVPLASRP
jgi:hypothetical protein